MEVKELKTKIKVVFPPEAEIFMAEEFLSLFGGVDITQKEIEADFSETVSMDTVFLQIALSLVNTAKSSGHKITIKSSDALDSAMKTYGINIDELTGGA